MWVWIPLGATVQRLAAEYIELEMDEEIREALSEGEFRDDPVGLAMRRFNFYQCHKCSVSCRERVCVCVVVEMG